MARGNALTMILGLGAIAGAGYLIYSNWDKLFSPQGQGPVGNAGGSTGGGTGGGTSTGGSGGTGTWGTGTGGGGTGGGPAPDPCANINCPAGQVCQNGVCVPTTPNPPTQQCPQGTQGTWPNCQPIPTPGTQHCQTLCQKFPFCSDADITNWLDKWTKQAPGAPDDAEMTGLLDCWVKLGKCPSCK
jgi:hypothetical protein